MKINKNKSIIYITCPANFATGGPYLLHQLAYKLIQLGYNAKMFYLTESINEDPVHEFYADMKIPYSLEIENNYSNLIVIPETFTNLIFKYENIQKVIWWLSVDNFLESDNKKPSFSTKRFLGLKKERYYYNFQKKPKHFHWVQSFYAERFLKSKGISNIKYLSDYLNDIFIDEVKNIKFDSTNKEDIISYNPKKGYEVTKILIEKTPHLKWVPIENMTPNEVKELLLKSKIYIDFGHHPGKDRIPREAAICGCIVITNTKGSAVFFEDVSIPDQYKIEYSHEDETKIVELLETCLSDYDVKLKDFEFYKNKIINEEIRFNQDLEAIIKGFESN
jgi:hypothetical protein